ncbi:MAG: NUDIX hydrolase [Candidatus Nealsonbacteria bacterium]
MKKSKIKITKTKSLYKGNEISLNRIDWKFKGKEMRKEVVIFPNTVAVLPLIKKDKVILVKQYRFPAEKELWEVPAGKLDKDEKPEEGAKRELEEETGFKTGKLEKIGEFYVSPGYTTEYMYLFRADLLKKGNQALDNGEIINNVKIFDLKEVLKMIRDKRIIDVKTILAVKLEVLDYHFSLK